MLMVSLAFRNILRNRRRTLITLSSMSGAFLLLVASISIQDGSYDQILKVFTQDQIGHAQMVHPDFRDSPSLYNTLALTPDIIQQLDNQAQVNAWTPRIQSAAMAYGEHKTYPVVVMGIDSERERKVSFLADKISTGQWFQSKTELQPVMIGALVAQQLELSIGQELVLLSQGADGSMANDVFEVSAIIGSKTDMESRLVYLPLVAAQEFYVLNDKVHMVVLLANNYLSATEKMVEVLVQQATFDHLTIEPWQVVAKEFYDTMTADKEGGYISMYVIVFLVCLGLWNTILMSVMERTGEFGVLKAIGTSGQRIFSLIIIEVFLLVSIAIVIGLIISVPMNLYLSMVGFSLPEPMEISGLVMSHMQGTMALETFLFPIRVVFFMSLLVSILPAIRAARIVPVDAMRSL